MPVHDSQGQRALPAHTGRSRNALFESLPVELIAEILSEVDLESLITVASLSRRLRSITSDSALNPWKRPIVRNLQRRDGMYEPCMTHLAEHSIFPRANWLDILSAARADFLLFDATLPNLPESDYAEAFRRRFLPTWAKRGKDGCRWREVYRK